MANHHIKLFIDQGKIVYIHYQPSNQDNPEPGTHLEVMPGEKIRWHAPKQQHFTVEFKAESPFVNGRGAPGNKIDSPNGSMTPLETAKSIAPTYQVKTFKYTVTLAGLADDPEIIINDSGGGGAKKARKKK